MKKLLLTSVLMLASTSAFAQGRFYVGGSWSVGAPGPVRVYNPPPPPPRVGFAYGARPIRPGADFIWIDGYYDYVGRGYNWRPGYWARRPHPSARWVRPGYGRGQYRPGYWRR